MELFPSFLNQKVSCLDLERLKNPIIVNILEKNICSGEVGDFKDG